MESSRHRVQQKQSNKAANGFFAKLGKNGQKPIKNNRLLISDEAFIIGRKLRLPKHLIGVLILAFLFNFVGFFTPILAVEAVEDANKAVAPNGAVLSETETEMIQEELVFKEHLPDVSELSFYNWGIKTITAYNSEVWQCDASPCVTANGFNVCEHGIEDTIAANFLKFGTKVRIPELFGDRLFVVRDRMNKRYPNRVDVWMLDKSDAKQFGVKRTKIEVVIED